MPIPSYPIGTPGQPWGANEVAQWRARQQRQRRYADEVLAPLQTLVLGLECLDYGAVVYADERFPLVAVRSTHWDAARPSVLVTGGVHGYESSGVRAALAFACAQAAPYVDQANLLIVPCVSPWAFERIQRWNHDAIDPNRSFRPDSPAQESAALMRLLAPLHGQFAAHIDLHETTDSDESEFRPALAARDGKPFEPGTVPDGFYVVDDSEHPHPAFQQAVLDAVARVMPIAPADARGEIIGSPVVAPGVIRYPLQALGLCASVSGARATTTTEVYPDSPGTSAAQCVAAQLAAVCAAVDFAVAGRV